MLQRSRLISQAECRLQADHCRPREAASTEPPDFSGGMGKSDLGRGCHLVASTEPPDFSGGMKSICTGTATPQTSFNGAA